MYIIIPTIYAYEGYTESQIQNLEIIKHVFISKIKEEEIYKIKETVRSMDQLNQTLENRIQEFEKSSKMLETNLIKKSNECDLYR